MYVPKDMTTLGDPKNHVKFSQTQRVNASYLLIPIIEPDQDERNASALMKIEISYSSSSFMSFKLISAQIITEASSEKLPLVEINSPAFLSLLGIP